MATHSRIFAWRVPLDRGAWWATVRGVVKSQTGLRDEGQHIDYFTYYSNILDIEYSLNVE